jgi:hypothetical protein
MTKKKKLSAKKPAKKAARKKAKAREYVEPKTALELGYLCKSLTDAGECGRPPVWFDYDLGEVNHLSGFVCDEHKTSRRLEKLGQPKQMTSAAV